MSKKFLILKVCYKRPYTMYIFSKILWTNNNLNESEEIITKPYAIDLEMSSCGVRRLSAQGHVVNSFSFLDHKGCLSYQILLLQKPPERILKEGAWLCPIKTLFMDLKCKFYTIFMCHKMLFFFWFFSPNHLKIGKLFLASRLYKIR